jgi:hypothetical protein
MFSFIEIFILNSSSEQCFMFMQSRMSIVDYADILINSSLSISFLSIQLSCWVTWLNHSGTYLNVLKSPLWKSLALFLESNRFLSPPRPLEMMSYG